MLRYVLGVVLSSRVLINDVQTLFIHPTEDYDFIIKLDRTVVPRYFQNVVVDAGALSRRGKYANLASSRDSVRPGFDPVQLFFQDLQVCVCVYYIRNHQIHAAF